MAAAQVLFLRRGFNDVSMEAVAAAAGVSKMTVYSHFGDKESLFEAVVRRTTGDVMAGMAATGRGSGALTEQLLTIGQSYLQLVCSPDIVSCDRALTHSLAGNRALAQRFYDAGPGYMRASISHILQAAIARGELRDDDTLDMADDLLSLWQGHLPKRLALGVMAPMTAESIARQVERATGVFIRAYARTPPT